MTAMHARGRETEDMLRMKQDRCLSSPSLAVRDGRASRWRNLRCWVGECELKAEVDLPVANLEFMNLYF